MLRRQARERREYLYRKSLEGKQREEYEHRRQVREALREGKALPTERLHDEASLREKDEFADLVHDKPNTHEDDEYARAGEVDPKVVVTTSRDPSSRLKQFAKEVRLIFPGATRLNRGNLVIGDLMDVCRQNEVTDIVVIHEHRGEPDGLIVCHLPFGPTAFFTLSNVVMRHDLKASGEDIGTVSETNPHLIMDNFNSKIGQRTSNVLKYLFPVPKPSSKRVMTFSNRNDFISFRHHIFEPNHKPEDVKLVEIGPRFEMMLYRVQLGTLDQPEADDEWVLRPYMNTAKRRRVLG
mmetsp:Transcript_32418/g.127168  ORF Transcript_32418/g.127168 Transcript_32418/m.127168 type:complete len:294 (-) Transcript_32418:3179-4060(-)